MSSLLGFDYGSRKIGVAVGQTTTGTAQGIALIRAKELSKALDQVAPLVAEWRPDALVVGLPLTEDHAETPTSRAARRFGESLGKRFQLPVYWVNEYLSSQDAQYQLRETVAVGARFGTKKQLNRDLLAAELILRSHLEYATEC